MFKKTTKTNNKGKGDIFLTFVELFSLYCFGLMILLFGMNATRQQDKPKSSLAVLTACFRNPLYPSR